MKKLFSVFMALVLVLSLSMSIAAPAFALSYEGSSSSGSSSSSAIDTSAAYINDAGTLSNVPVKIYAFTTANTRVKVQIGNSTFNFPVTHKQDGSRIVSTIRCTLTGTNLDYGFGDPYNVKVGSVSANIKISHFGNSVGAHSFKVSGTYNVTSAFKVQYPSTSSTWTAVSAKSSSSLKGSAEGGYYSTSFGVSAYDGNTTLTMKTSYVAGLWHFSYTRHNIKLLNNALLSGKYYISH